MKHFLYIAACILLITSCSKNNNIQPFASSKIVFKNAGVIAFKAIPLSDSKLKIAMQSTGQRIPAKMILKLDTATLAIVALANSSPGVIDGVIDYPFQSGKKYDIMIQTSAVADTVYQYQIPAYQHQYVSHFSYNKILDLQQSLGPNDFDISPSRNYIFVADDIANKVKLSSINLQTLAVNTIDYDLRGGPLRAISDHELLVYGGNDAQNTPAKPDTGYDAVPLVRYDINTQTSVFVDYVSSGYGRVSRAINNHILVTNPIFTAKTASLIKLNDLSKVNYPLSNFDFTSIDQYSFGHIIYKNMLINTGDGSMLSPATLDANSGLIELDDATGYLFAGSGRKDNANRISTAFSIYKNNLPVYQSDYVYGRSYSLPIIFDIKNDVLVFYQYFGYDTSVNIDGYYSLNLKTKEIKLIQADSTPYVISDYQVKNGSIFSVRYNGVYELTPNN